MYRPNVQVPQNDQDALRRASSRELPNTPLGGVHRTSLPRTRVNKGKKESRGATSRPSVPFSRILLRVPPLPLSGLERLAQLSVRLSRNDKVEILVDGQLAHAVVREALGREYEDPGQVHHDPVTGLPEPEVHAVFDLGRAVEVARVRETVHEVAVRGEHHGRPFSGGREAPGACLRRFAEDPDEQPVLIPEGELLVLGTRRIGPAAREQGVLLVGPRIVVGEVTNDVVAGLRALRVRGKGRRERGGIDLVLRGGRCRARPHRRYDHRQHAHHQGAAQSNVHDPLTSPFLYLLSFGHGLARRTSGGSRKAYTDHTNPFLPLSLLGAIEGRRSQRWLARPSRVPVFCGTGF